MAAAALGFFTTAVSGWAIWKWIPLHGYRAEILTYYKKASALYIEKHEKELDDEYCTDDSDCIPFKV